MVERRRKHWGLKVGVLSQLGTVGFQGPLALQGAASRPLATVGSALGADLLSALLT